MAKASELCCAKYCGKTKAKKDRFCSKHRHKYNKENNPISYTYNYLKQNAKRRKKEFILTLAEFTQFCIDTNYIELKGKTGSSASIDRKDHAKGYSIDNIQILTLSENSRKRFTDYCPF